MNPRDFAAIAAQIAQAAQVPAIAAPQVAAWLGVVEALAQGRLTFAAPEVRDAQQAA